MGVGNVLIPGIDHGHAVAGIGGCFGELGQQACVVQLGFRVAAKIHAPRLEDDLWLVLLIDGQGLLLGEHPFVAVDQLGAGGKGGQVGGKAALFLDHRHGDHLEPSLSAGAGQLDVELGHRLRQGFPVAAAFTFLLDAQAIGQ